MHGVVTVVAAGVIFWFSWRGMGGDAVAFTVASLLTGAFAALQVIRSNSRS